MLSHYSCHPFSGVIFEFFFFHYALLHFDVSCTTKTINSHHHWPLILSISVYLFALLSLSSSLCIDYDFVCAQFHAHLLLSRYICYPFLVSFSKTLVTVMLHFAVPFTKQTTDASIHSTQEYLLAVYLVTMLARSNLCSTSRQ